MYSQNMGEREAHMYLEEKKIKALQPSCLGQSFSTQRGAMEEN
jgi:hypothetical protein